MTVNDFRINDNDFEEISNYIVDYIDDFNKTNFNYNDVCDIASYAALIMYDFMFDKVIQAAQETKQEENNSGIITIDEAAEIIELILQNIRRE